MTPTMPQQQGPQKLTWKDLASKMEINIENTEKRLELLKAQLKLVYSKNKE